MRASSGNGRGGILATLQERGRKNGTFEDAARVTQAIKLALRNSPNWAGLPDSMKEALEMDANKTGRILAGDSLCHDHWHDKAGYATLVANGLAARESEARDEGL